MSYDLCALREAEFPWALRGESIYLNNASTGPLPTRTVAAENAFTALRAEPFRLDDDAQFAVVRRARELSARLIGARTGEIALMTNTTYGINLAARALSLGAGDVILTYDGEFPANIYPWMALERQGVRLERIPLVDGVPDEDALVDAMDRPGVRVVAVSWVQFSTGAVANLARLGRECRARGIRLVVDAIQGVGALQLDVHACEIDMLACGGQKWLLSPWGTGFVYVREELASSLEPSAVGWLAMAASEDFTRLTDYEFRYWPDARRFEVFTLPFQDFAGFNASLELLLELGPAAIDEHVRALGSRIADWAASRSGVRLRTPIDPARRGAIISVVPPDPVSASTRLTNAGIKHSLREGAIRLAPHAYNTESEVDAALEALEG